MRFALLPLALALMLAPPLHAAAADRAADGSAVPGPDIEPGPDIGAANEPSPDAAAPSGARLRAPLELTIGGRLHADASRHRRDEPPARAADGTDLRRARIRVGGRLDRDWQFSAELDAADPDQPVRDFWLRYEGWSGIGVAIGHQKQPYSLALETSSNDLPFVERGIDNALVASFVDRALGIRVDASRGRWFAAAGVYGGSIDDDEGGWGTSARLVYAPVAGQRETVHLGLRAAYREPGADGAPLRIRDETTNSSSLHIVDAGPLAGVDRVVLFGPEAALVIGALSLFSEYTVADIERETGTSRFDAWHIGATWALGGESRAAAYSPGSGRFERLEPERAFSRGEGGGTWEIAARYASIDLNDGALVGGEEKRLTLGANWYANEHVRVLLDWSRIVDTDDSNAVRAAANGLDVFTVRFQLAF